MRISYVMGLVFTGEALAYVGQGEWTLTLVTASGALALFALGVWCTALETR